MSDPTTQYVADHYRSKAYRRLDRIRKRIQRERVAQLFHGEESFAGYLAGVHLATLHRQRADLLAFLDRE